MHPQNLIFLPNIVILQWTLQDKFIVEQFNGQSVDYC